MTKSDNPAAPEFTPAEREYIRRELDQFFSTLPTVAEGFQLRTWRGGGHIRAIRSCRRRPKPSLTAA